MRKKPTPTIKIPRNRRSPEEIQRDNELGALCPVEDDGKSGRIRMTSAQRKLCLTMMARYDPAVFGFTPLKQELDRVGLNVSLSALRFYKYSPKWNPKIVELRKSLFTDDDMLIRKKNYRLAWLQKFVEDSNNKLRDRIVALKEARMEVEGNKTTVTVTEDWDSLSAERKDRFESLFRRVLDAESVEILPAEEEQNLLPPPEAVNEIVEGTSIPVSGDDYVSLVGLPEIPDCVELEERDVGDVRIVHPEPTADVGLGETRG